MKIGNALPRMKFINYIEMGIQENEIEDSKEYDTYHKKGKLSMNNYHDLKYSKLMTLCWHNINPMHRYIMI